MQSNVQPNERPAFSWPDLHYYTVLCVLCTDWTPSCINLCLQTHRAHTQRLHHFYTISSSHENVHCAYARTFVQFEYEITFRRHFASSLRFFFFHFDLWLLYRVQQVTHTYSFVLAYVRRQAVKYIYNCRMMRVMMLIHAYVTQQRCITSA